MNNGNALLKLNLFSPLYADDLHTLLEHGKPALISRNLRTILFEYIEDELNIGATSCFLDLLPQLNYLFNFLDEAANTKGLPISAVTKKHAGVEDENCASWLFADDLLYRVTVFLVTTLEPERIYRIIHQPTEQGQCVTDLLIVLPDSMQEKPFCEYETLIEAGCSLGTNMTFSLHQASHVNTAVTEGHIFYSFICTNDNLMYWNKEKEWPVTPINRMQELSQSACQQFQNNFGKAETFLQYASLSLEQQNNKLTAFFLQQAVELCCRAIITALTGKDKKTHAMAVLKKTCRRCTTVVEHTFRVNTEEDKRLLKILDDAYIAARYEDGFSLSAADMELLLRKVQQLHNAALNAVKKRLNLSTQNKTV